MMLIFLTDCVGKHGFTRDVPAYARHGADFSFSRSTDAGRQTIEMKIGGSIPYLDCKIDCLQYTETVETVYQAIYGVNPTDATTLYFNVGAFDGNFHNSIPFRTAAEIKDIFVKLATRALPVLEITKTKSGLNDVLNGHRVFPVTSSITHPNFPRTLKDSFRQHTLRPLITAWLLKDPMFETLCGEFRLLDNKRPGLTVQDVDDLVHRLKHEH